MFLSIILYAVDKKFATLLADKLWIMKFKKSHLSRKFERPEKVFFI